MELMMNAGLLEGQGYSSRVAKQCFLNAKMCVVDEIKHKHRMYELTFIEFTEAFARMSEAISPPSIEDLETFMVPYLGNNEVTDRHTMLTYEFFKRKASGMFDSAPAKRDTSVLVPSISLEGPATEEDASRPLPWTPRDDPVESSGSNHNTHRSSTSLAERSSPFPGAGVLRRESAYMPNLAAPPQPTRSLAVKMSQMLEVTVGALMQYHQVEGIPNMIRWLVVHSNPTTFHRM